MKEILSSGSYFSNPEKSGPGAGERNDIGVQMRGRKTYLSWDERKLRFSPDPLRKTRQQNGLQIYVAKREVSENGGDRKDDSQWLLVLVKHGRALRALLEEGHAGVVFDRARGIMSTNDFNQKLNLGEILAKEKDNL